MGSGLGSDDQDLCLYQPHHHVRGSGKWPIEIFSRLLPRVYQIVEEINRRFEIEIRNRFPGDEGKVARMGIIRDGQVKMAHLAIAAGYSVNGVAKLHTEMLKDPVFKRFL